MTWEDIVDRHGPLVWRCAYRLLGNHAAAADCYQEAFAAALLSEASAPPLGAPWAALEQRAQAVSEALRAAKG